MIVHLTKNNTLDVFQTAEAFAARVELQGFAAAYATLLIELRVYYATLGNTDIADVEMVSNVVIARAKRLYHIKPPLLPRREALFKEVLGAVS